MRKALYIAGSALALLLTTSVYLVLSHSGNAFIWQQIVQRVDPLNGEITDGNLLSGWTIKNLRWDDQSLIFSCDSIALHWQFSAMLDKKLPISLIKIENPSVEIIPASTEPAEEKKQSDSPPEIPVDISIEQITVHNLSFKSEATEIFLDSFTGQLQLDNSGLFLSQLEAGKLDIQVFSFEENTNESESDLSPIVLPIIELPLPIHLNKLTLKEVNFQQGEIKEQIHNLELSVNAEGSELKDLTLQVDHAMASAALSGEITLTGVYPLSIDLKTNIHKPLLDGELENQTLKLHAAGTLDNLQLELNASGPIKALLRGSIQPLNENLPFDASLSWQSLQWPPSSEPKLVTAKNGSLIIAGDLKKYDLRLDTHLEVPKQPATSILLSGSGNLEQLNIETLKLNAPDGHLALTGKVRWKDQISWQGSTSLVNLNPKYWVPTLPGKLSGSVNSHFVLANGHWQVDIPKLSIHGFLRQYPLELAGKASLQQSDSKPLPISGNIDHLEARIGKNSLRVNGTLTEKLALQAQINAPAPQEIHPEIQGLINGDIDISGSPFAPVADFYLKSPQLLFQEFNISNLEANGHIAAGKEISGQADIAIGDFSSPQLSLQNIRLAAEGNEQQHQLIFASDGDPFAASFTIGGSWNTKQWQGQLSKAQLKTPLDQWTLEAPLQLTATPKMQLTLSGQCWLSREAKFCTQPANLSPDKGEVLFQLTQFNLERLAAFYPESFAWKSTLSSQGKAQWENKEPEISLQVKTEPGVLQSGELSFDYDQLEVLANFRQQRLSSSVQFQSQQLGHANIELAVEDIAQQQKLSGNVLLEKLRLDFLTGLIPQLEKLDGELSAKTRLDGTLKEPLLYGQVSLTEGQLSARDDIVSISQLTTELDIQGNKGKIDGSMNVGDGILYLGGQLDWQQLPPTGYVTLKGDSVEFAYPGYLRIKISPDLKFTMDKAMALEGRIVIPWTRIEIKELPVSAVKVSEDAIVMTDQDESDQQSKSAPFKINVDVVLGDDLKLEAYGLKTNLGGHLKLRQEASQSLTGHGSIKLLKGRYRYLGQDLLIQEGNIIFSGPLSNPHLVVDAIRNPETVQADVKVGISVNGPLSRPQWEVYTDPAMSQQEQLSYLLRGRGLENGDDSGLQSLLIGAGVSQFGGVVSSVGEAIGFSDVTLDTEGSGSDTQVTIGGNIAPGLRLQYGAGVFKPIAEIKVRYELMPRLYLQVISGLAQAVDLFYQFKIDTTKKAPGRPGVIPGHTGKKDS